MVTVYRKIILIKTKRPTSNDPNEEVKWLGTSLGLFTLRDKDSSCYRIFIELLKSTKQDKKLSSDEIAARLALTRGTVIHHMNRLMESGLVVVEGNKYTLRENNLNMLLDEIKKDIDNTYSDLKKIAEDLDRWLGL
jgi:predicted transcriptional regulator